MFVQLNLVKLTCHGKSVMNQCNWVGSECTELLKERPMPSDIKSLGEVQGYDIGILLACEILDK